MRVMTMRFGMLGGGALVVLLITGVVNYFHAKDLGYISNDDFPRYFIDAADQADAGDGGGHPDGAARRGVRPATAELAGVRRAGRGDREGAAVVDAASMATLAPSVAILFCAALLASNWSKSGCASLT